ncbi:hypothetical protein [Chitinophaga polysaccharea]|uniref:hypothetical protein n=1 Tax=Chitinophaga polysaccharea TaxID=1293035 RepID=UPI0011591565|nr:hypothetical protein [Chitinophaga polysaccharea]
MTNEILRKIADTLIERKAATAELSISRGLAGMSLFLFQYSKLLKDEYYYNEAFEILDNIHTRLSDPSKKMQDEQLPDIGWLFLLLLKEDLIDIDADEVLQSIDTAMYNKCVYSSFKQLGDGYLLKIALYFHSRHLQVKSNHHKVKIEEALIHIIDDIRHLYTPAIKRRVFDVWEKTDISSIVELHHLIGTINCICIVLSKIYQLEIGRQFISNVLFELYADLEILVLQNQHFHIKAHDDYYIYNSLAETMLGILSIGPIIKSVLSSEYISLLKYREGSGIYSMKPTYFIGNLVSMISCLRQCNHKDIFTNEIQRLVLTLFKSIQQNKPGSLNAKEGLPNLGLREGLSGASMMFLLDGQEPTFYMEELLVFLKN